MSKLHSFGGNIAIPIGGQFGFGLPSIGNDESTGPQILVVQGDPNGTIEAPIGSFALDQSTPSLWQNTGGTTWVLAGVSGSAETQFVVGSVPTTVVAPNNLLSDNNNVLAGNAQTEVVAPHTGTYILTVTFLLQATVTA